MNAVDCLTALARDSAAAGVLVLLVLATQQFLGKQLSPRWSCALWLLVIARLLPFSVNSTVSIFNVLPSGVFTRRLESAANPVATTTLQGVFMPSRSKPVAVFNPAKNGHDAPSIANSTAGSESPDAGSLIAGLFWVWLGVVMALSFHVLIVSICLGRRVWHLPPLEEPATLDMLRDCCERMGVRRVPLLVQSGDIATPVLHGLLRPRLLLPQGFTQAFSGQELRFVFLHELAHLRRRDLWLNWVVTAMQVVHWFNPLIWVGFARWRVDREIACDAMAIAAAGSTQNREYGRTILRLLQTFASHTPRPGLVGILEDRGQLRRRIRMIARYAPARRRPAAIVTTIVLAVVGLTDAQVTSPPVASVSPLTLAATINTKPEAPVLSGPYVLFLVNGSETMLGETREEIGLRRTQSDEQKRAAPKWQRTAQTLQSAIMAMARGTAYQVVIGRDSGALSLGWGVWDGSSGNEEVEGIVRRLGRQTPGKDFDLEVAFDSMNLLKNGSQPERIVLLTDGLPTTGQGLRNDGTLTETQRIQFLEHAAISLPPQVPVQTLLLPLLPGDPGATGLLWSLANATHGGLICPAPLGRAAPTHLAFVIDTSGSMRDPKTGELWPIVLETIDTMLSAPPLLTGVQILDGDGRFILGRRGSGAGAWLPNTPEIRESIQRTLRRYDQDTVSNPVPGINNALRFLYDKDARDLRMGITVFGDEFNSSDSAAAVMQRLDELNPADASGQRSITISAVGFPTTIRRPFSMGNTGLRFASLMRTITHQHGGGFIGLPDL